MPKLTENSFISVPCIKIIQPIGQFYIAAMKWHDLKFISFTDVRRLEEGKDLYLGIQRRLSKDRVFELKKYVNNVDATFPTGVILAIESENIRFNKKENVLEILNKNGVAKVIDGQHRIAGLEGFQYKEFDINVTIFVDMDIEDQAMVFAKINLAQTKVNKSLTYDLYEYTKNRSPQKTSHDIVILLNSKEESPLFKRFKLLGFASDEFRELQVLTQATFVEQLLPMISGSLVMAEEDRETIRKANRLESVPFSELRRFPFRNMFIEKMDAEIAKVLWNYFSAVQQRWPSSWNFPNKSGNFLPRTNGFRALMKFFSKAYIHLGGPPHIYSTKEFLELLKMVKIKARDFTVENYPPGTSGETKFYKELLKQTGLE